MNPNWSFIFLQSGDGLRGNRCRPRMERMAALATVLLCACASSGGAARQPMTAAECQSRLQALEAQADAARAEARPAQDTYRNNPSSFEAKSAVELALQRSARIVADSAREAEELRRGPCKGKL